MRTFEEVWGRAPDTIYELQAFEMEQEVLEQKVKSNGHTPGAFVPPTKMRLASADNYKKWLWESEKYLHISDVPDGAQFLVAYIGEPKFRKGPTRNTRTWGIGVVFDSGERWLYTPRCSGGEGTPTADRDEMFRDMQTYLSLNPDQALRVTKRTTRGSHKDNRNGTVFLTDATPVPFE